MPSNTPLPAATTLAQTLLIDSEHPAVLEFAARHARGRDERERAVALYYAVRDGIRYDPYRIDLSPAGMCASRVLELGYGWCVPKAALLAAVARAAGIPARLGYADVRNHLSTARMRETMQTDVFIWHGYTELWLDGRWIKSTPAFNVELCERFGLLPLEWNGVDDSLYHAFDSAGRQHMEYLGERGSYDDMPLAHIVADFTRTYPNWLRLAQPGISFDADVGREAMRADGTRPPSV